MSAAKRKRVLVTGGSGFLGAHLIVALREDHDVSFSWHHRPTQIPGAKGVSLELRSKKTIAETLLSLKPEVILHCAAMTDVDFCEEHPEEARRINAEATRHLAQEAKKLNAHFIFISTEAVYEGTKGDYSEKDPVSPINVYAKTKWEGENAVRETGGEWLIARTGFEGWRLNDGGKLSFFEWLVKKFGEGKPFPVFKDRYFSPTSVTNLAEVLKEAIEKKLTGLFNIEGKEKTTYLEFARTLAGIFGGDETLIVPSSLDDHPAIAKRPKDTSLDVRKIQERIETPLWGVREILLNLVKKELANGAEKKYAGG